MDETTAPPTDATPGPGLDLEIGPKIASGRDADIFGLDGGRVLRRYREARKTAELEAEIMRYVRAQGYPVPVVHAVSGTDMIIDRVDGPTMLKDLGKRPWMVWRHARLLTALHRRLHRIPAPDWIPAYASHPAFQKMDEAEAARAGLPPMSPPSSGALQTLLHLDLHPDNVILSPRGPVVIDWRNTRRGEGAVDVATTWLILATSKIPDRGIEGMAMDLIRRLLVIGFVRHAGRDEAARQIPAVARHRLVDPNVFPSERTAIYALARRAASAR